MSVGQPNKTQQFNQKRMRRKSSVSASEACVVYNNYFPNISALNANDIVRNGYHKHDDYNQSLPDIEHFAILLYYNIKHCTVPQLKQLWSQLYSLANWSKRENISLPTIRIRFESGNAKLDSDSLFRLIMEDKVMDLAELKRIFNAYYGRTSKTISAPTDLYNSDHQMDMLSEGITRGGNKWYDMVLNELTPMTPFGGKQEELTIFGAFKPKIAIVATAFAVAVSFGFRISRATNLGYSH